MTLKLYQIFIVAVIFGLNFIFSKPLIRSKNGYFYDREGRMRLFHGINIVVKNPPFIPDDRVEFDAENGFNDIDIDFLLEMGFNIVRLGITWEAVEYEPGKYNDTYIDEINSLILKLGKIGIYTILDNHQDLISRKFCGQGIPLFYSEKLEYDKFCNVTFLSNIMKDSNLCVELEDHNTNELRCNNLTFPEKYTSIDISSAYNSFYNNNNGILDRLSNYWKYLSQNFKDNRYIIGYDIWNEPFASNTHTSVLSHIPGYLTNTILYDFYKKVSDAIYDIDQTTSILFEPIIYPDSFPFFGGRYWGGFSSLPGINANIFNEHFYCIGQSTDLKDVSKLSTLHILHNCAKFSQRKIESIAKLARSIGSTPIITEFGACINDENCKAEIDITTNECDNHLTSWIYWQYKNFQDHTTHCEKEDGNQGLFNSDKSVQMFKAKALSRPYFLAFQGEVSIMKFYPELNLLHSEFNVNIDIDEHSILYINRKLYSKGFKLLLIYDIKELLVEDLQNKFKQSNNHLNNFPVLGISTSNGRNLNYELDSSISSEDLNKSSLNYIKIKFIRNTNYYKEDFTVLPIKVFLAKSIRYKFSIVNERQAVRFEQFNIKISDISKINETNLNSKKVIVYLRTKNINLDNTDFRAYAQFSVGHSNICDKSKLKSHSTELSHNLFVRQCDFNSECVIDAYFLKSLKIGIHSKTEREEGEIIEWTFLNVLNHRILINFN